LTTKSAKAILGIWEFWAQDPAQRSIKEPGGGRIPKEPGPGTPRNNSPLALSVQLEPLLALKGFIIGEKCAFPCIFAKKTVLSKEARNKAYPVTFPGSIMLHWSNTETLILLLHADPPPAMAGPCVQQGGNWTSR
jgi:hypothetical protein